MSDSSARAVRTVVVVPAAGDSPRPALPSLDQLQAGDEAAYEKLVTVFSPWMQRVARKHVQSAGLAEDIVQETWLAVLRELGTLPRSLVTQNLDLSDPGEPGKVRRPPRAARDRGGSTQPLHRPARSLSRLAFRGISRAGGPAGRSSHCR